MKYVYKIVGEFNDDNFARIISKITAKFLLMYVDNTMFIALKSWSEYEGSEELVSKVFKPARDFYIKEVNERVVETLGPSVKEWCLTNIHRLQNEQSDYENQSRLKEASQSLDRFEEELKKLQEQQKLNSEK